MTARPIPTAALILYALLLALGLGIGSAYAVLDGDPPFGSRRLGPWQAWPKLGSPQADPYMRAIVARRGDIPLATGEGLALTALVDKDGRRLDSACSYRIGSSTPAARWWTLTVYDAAGRLAQSDLGRSGFTSSEILRDARNGFSIALSRHLSAGNWLQLPASGPFIVVLRLYDIPGAAGLNLNAEDLPTIERVECGA
ncbi:DUF1214 domain-containing protein [Microvirga thermotolerans]|uniref:DUF1214 domain-containing protein n=1 Tax=Microvirga thermotolerans TaxID=2651334 RepID=UPI001883D936|nr:DUF1214 domain-containing protein [Microvirga thermotolerans]